MKLSCAAMIILFFAVCLIIVGLMRGEFFEVMTKGAYLCLECIGIG